MAVSADQVAVNTTAVALNDPSSAGLTLVVKAAAVAVDLGPSDVTVGGGFELAADQTVTVHVDSGDALYAVAGSATTVHVLRT